jgi:DNA-binding GntR family transcriptional regulator
MFQASDGQPQSAGPASLAPLETQNVQELVYQRLKEGIITNAFVPGQQLLVRELAQQLGTSTTPLVQAMLRLSQEGLVTILPRKGTFVAVLHDEDIRLLFEAREAVETHAAVLAARRATPSAIDELHALLEHWLAIRRSLKDGIPSVGAQPLFEADSDFHVRVVALAGNTYLDEMYHKLDTQIWAFTRRRLSRYHDAVQDVAHHGHLRIVEALTHGDAQAVAYAVSAHIWEVHVLYAQLMQPGEQIVPPLAAGLTRPPTLTRKEAELAAKTVR